MILILTVFVPFVANKAPYTAVIDGQREWPLLKDLTRVDWVWLVWGFLERVVPRSSVPARGEQVTRRGVGSRSTVRAKGMVSCRRR